MSSLENFTVFECPGIRDQFDEFVDPIVFQETSIIRDGECVTLEYIFFIYTICRMLCVCACWPFCLPALFVCL